MFGARACVRGVCASCVCCGMCGMRDMCGVWVVHPCKYLFLDVLQGFFTEMLAM